MTGVPPAGWYPDPSGAPQLRWWDGQRWASHVAPDPAVEQRRFCDEAVTRLRSGRSIVWRTPTGLRWTFHLLAVLSPGVVVVAAVQDPGMTVREGVLWTVLMASMLLVIDAVAGWRPRLELRVDEVVVRRTFDTRTVRLRDLESIGPESSYGIRLNLADGSRLQATAVQKPNWAIGRNYGMRADLVAATILAAKRALLEDPPSGSGGR